MRKGLSCSEAGKLGAIASIEPTAKLKQERIDKYLANPLLCQYCNGAIAYKARFENKFCSSSCAATYHNQNRKVQKYCLHCNKEIVYENKYCSMDCLRGYNWKNTKEKLLKTGIDSSSSNIIGKKYLIELHGKCQICKLSEWQGQPMPLVLDHIDGDPYNNLLLNLRVVCNNCDAISPTFKGRNKGNGRFKRAERYQTEKETIKLMKADIVLKA